MDIWAACRDEVQPEPLEGRLIRMVENQEQTATRALVDDLAEQALLEEMLEAGKPPLPPETAGLHYLLATPFRYPPLKHGSRFGARHEPALFYGSTTPGAALAETAYYRFVFWWGMMDPPPAGRLMTEHTAFGAAYAAGAGLRLHRPPFDAFEHRLASPDDYSDTQLLGRQLRAAGVEAFEYRSARDPGRGINVALFTPRAFAGPKPLWQQTWLCDTRGEEVVFYSKEEGACRFALGLFLVEGELPTPAV